MRSAARRARRLAQIDDRPAEPGRAARGAAAGLACRCACPRLQQGVQILRVHDVGGNPPGARRVAGDRCGVEFSGALEGGRCAREWRRRPRPRQNIELFDPDAHPFDPRIGKAGAADPLGKALAQIDMPGAGNLPDCGDHFLVVDDAPAVLSGKGMQPPRAPPIPGRAAWRSRSRARIPMLQVRTSPRTVTV